MPTPHEQELWSVLLVEEPDFGKAKQIINNYPQENLIRSINERGSSVIMAALDTEKKDPNFIEFVLNHQNFDIAFEAPQWNDSNLKRLISSALPHIIEKYKNNPLMFDTNKNLGYELAKESLGGAEYMYETLMEEDPNSDDTKQADARVKNLKSILAIIRDATIRYAIPRDNASILIRLDAAGASLSNVLLDGKTYPSELIDINKHPKVNALFDQFAARAAGRLSNNLNTHINAAAKLNELAKEKQQLDKLKLEAQARAIANGVSNLANLAETMSLVGSYPQ